ncbi:GspH/FimT family pseudopilin [Solilutibacter silvestris]|uniref:Type II secretion system protein H n=1 Tax=Solilutibacter silvestris TaxID=1645665 RepID=A0A2K1Q387_9GAMM|nr:GspH/FimT family pseudopilin [Lysobacter silvestris]PNS09510.1 prepilin-type N-terminal cleavage/methylation domain [Lysobacter silvestris]
MRTAQAGFTLIELMASVAVLAILVAIGAPNLGRMAKAHRANAALNALTADLALARITAIARGKAVTACPSRDAATCMDGSDWTEGWLVFVDDDRDRRLGPGEQLLSSQQALRTTSLQLRSTDGRGTVRYLPSGFSFGSNATISACLDGRLHAALIVNNAGRVRVERASGPPRSCDALQG